MGDISKSKRLRVFERANWKCECCGTELVYNTDNQLDPVKNPNYATIDHITPVSLGGKNTETNLRALCRRCNSSRSNRAGSKLIEQIAKKTNVALIEKYYSKVVDEMDLGHIQLSDIELIESAIKNSYEENMLFVKNLKEYLAR